MNKRNYLYFLWFAIAGILLAGGGRQSGKQTEETKSVAATETNFSTVYAETDRNEELADFLIQYYQIPDEACYETRYYYNLTDLNEDGKEEIIAVVVGEYTECDGGDPALILKSDEDGYHVLESFDYIRTPVYISDEMTDGWHDLIFPAHGGEEGTGFKKFHYRENIGYQNDEMEFSEDLDENFRGKKILSNNLIDDMDRGNYLTLK